MGPVVVEHRRTHEQFTAWRDLEFDGQGRELVWLDDPSGPGYVPLSFYRIVG